MSKLKSFLTTMQKLAAGDAMLRFSTPSGSDKTFVSVVSPTSHAFSIFPFFLGEDHEPSLVTLESLNSVASASTEKTTVTIDNDCLVVDTPRKGRTELAMRPAVDALSAEPTLAEPSLELNITKDSQAFFKQVLPVLGMEKIHAAQADFRLYVDITKKRIFVAVYSPMQIVSTSTANPGIETTGSFNVPYPVFLSLIKSLPENDSSVAFSDDQMLLSTSGFSVLHLIAPLSPKDPPGDIVKQRAQEIIASADSLPSVSFPKTSMKEFLDYSKGVLTDDTPVRFTPTAKGVELSGSTVGSKSTFLIKADQTTLTDHFSLELKFLRNLMAKSGETIHLSVSNGILLMKSGSLSVITTTYSDDI